MKKLACAADTLYLRYSLYWQLKASAGCNAGYEETRKILIKMEKRLGWKNFILNLAETNQWTTSAEVVSVRETVSATMRNRLFKKLEFLCFDLQFYSTFYRSSDFYREIKTITLKLTIYKRNILREQLGFTNSEVARLWMLWNSTWSGCVVLKII